MLSSKRFRFWLSSALAVVIWSFPGGEVLCGESDTRFQEEETKVDFAAEIAPLIATHCLRCHGPEEQEADFRVDDAETVLLYIEPGDPENSELYERLVTDDEDLLMPPPEEGGPLAPEIAKAFAEWIEQGADWPDGVKIEPPPKEVVEQQEQEIQTKKQEQDMRDSSWQLLWEICGLIHPVAVHFPTALLIAGALFALFGFRGESPMSDAAYYCLWLGALSAILAVFTGWSFAIREGYLNWQSFEFQRTIDLHRWGGVLVAVLAFFLAIAASMSRRRDPYGTGAVWKLSLMLLAIIVGFVSHQGGKMTHEGLHEELMNKANIVIDNIRGENQGQPVEQADQDKDKDDKDQDKEPAASQDEDPAKEKDADKDETDSSKQDSPEGSGKTSDDQ